MRQIANDVHTALLRHIPVLTEAVRGSRNGKVRTSAYVLSLACRRMWRVELKSRSKSKDKQKWEE